MSDFTKFKIGLAYSPNSDLSDDQFTKNYLPEVSHTPDSIWTMPIQMAESASHTIDLAMWSSIDCVIVQNIGAYGFDVAFTDSDSNAISYKCAAESVPLVVGGVAPASDITISTTSAELLAKAKVVIYGTLIAT